MNYLKEQNVHYSKNMFGKEERKIKWSFAIISQNFKLIIKLTDFIYKMFINGIKLTIKCYKEHMDWMNECTSDEYKNWLDKNYKDRK